MKINITHFSYDKTKKPAQNKGGCPHDPPFLYINIVFTMSEYKKGDKFVIDQYVGNDGDRGIDLLYNKKFNFYQFRGYTSDNLIISAVIKELLFYKEQSIFMTRHRTAHYGTFLRMLKVFDVFWD